MTNNLKKEDGYILVVIIGILTVLSLMAITFATLSRIETRAVRNYNDSVKCEMLAKAGLEHALHVLQKDRFGSDTTAYNNDSGDESYDWSGETWMPGNVDLLNPLTSFAGTDYDNDGVSGADSKWIYFPAALSASGISFTGDLQARYALLITDQRETRVNLNVAGNKAGSGGVHTSDEGWSTFEIDLSYLIEQAAGLNAADGDNIAGDIIDARHGTDLKPGTSTTNDDSGIVPDPQTDGIDNDGDWVTGNDTNGNGIPDSGETDVDEASEVADEPNEFKALNPAGDDRPFGLLSEAEIMGSSGYTSRLETIYNNRSVSQSDQNSLNGWLTTISADTIVCPPYTLDGGTSTTRLNINALVNNQGAYTNTGTYNSDKKVEMIRDVLLAGGITGSSGSAGYVERHQLAVNIKDFIDADGTVTRYNDGVDTYYGVERTPYINEVEAQVDSTATDGVGIPTGMGKFIELFNPYSTAVNIANWTVTGTTMPAVTLTGPTITAQGYYVIADDQNAYTRDGSVHPKGFSYEGGADADQYDVNINSLTTTGEVLTLRDSGNNIVQVTNYGMGDDSKTRQLNDPRPTPLTKADGSGFPDIDTANPWRWQTKDEMAGSQNKDYKPDQGLDGWSTTTWQPSFILPNRSFSNRGYIGFIHRGRSWSSFRVNKDIDYPNVLQYITVIDPSMDGIDNDADGDIDTSDTGSQAGDIDGKENRIQGMINVNTAPKEVLMSLPGMTSTIADDIISKRSTPFSNIGDFVDRADKLTETGATKWDKEKIFRSISNLVTVRSNVFTVYVTAQVTDSGGSSVFAERRIIAIADRSVDPVTVRYFRWITE